MLKKRMILAALLTLSVIATAASSVMTQQGEMLREEFHQTYPLSPGGRVSLENINGSVRVSAWDRNEVKVDAVKLARRRDRLEEAKVIVNADPNSVHVETGYPTRTQTFNDNEGSYDNPATVEYTLTVPRTARVESIELINGDLNIDGISGDVKASSINGRLSAHELGGEVRLSTVNGKLEAVFGRLTAMKAISLNSVNGALSVTIPSDSNAELKAGTVHGGITNDFGLPVRRGEYVGRDLAGQLGAGGTRIKLGNVNGQISIKRAQDGRPLSQATNQLGEVADADEDNDVDHDEDFDVEETRSEARRSAREAAREAARARQEADEWKVEARRAELEAQRTHREAQREAARAQAQVIRKSNEVVRLSQAEAARVAAQAQREAQREAARIRVESQRIAREAARSVRVETDLANNLRLVERETKSFTVSGTPTLNMSTFDGFITVRGWDRQEVQVNISKRASTEQQMRGIRTNLNQNGSSIHFSSNFDDSYMRREGDVTFANAMVNVEVNVPRNSTLRLTTADGRLEVEGVNGSMTLTTGDGRIDVRSAHGRLAARTGDGRIDVQNFEGDVDANTGDGRIYLDGRFSAVNANTGSGSIMLAVPSDFNATIETNAEGVDNEGLSLTEESNSPGRMKRWKLGQGGKVFTLKTGEGRVFLRRAGQ
ncbi:MAG TPA: DUF4097 family beta strand repeat-containing protein [Pyrinomonadaceae bacterium]|nr:DUF4097 family beta strand repeat-containing protein [Pyrinomonadaceae bacterium]